MILPDVNVLVYAFRQDTPRHAICKHWLDGVVRGDAQFGISPLTLSAVLRITTNPRIFREPSPAAEAFAFCDTLLSQPHAQAVTPGERHWEIFKRIAQESDARGAHIADAWFAALAIEGGHTWITFDRDFARFRGLLWQQPA